MDNEFDRYAKSYDQDLVAAMPLGMEESEYFARYKIEHLARRCAGKTVARILDFGCGAGRSLIFLAEKFPQSQIFGFDPSSESVDMAKARCGTAYVTSDWQQVTEEKYDLILAANVFHHIPRTEMPIRLSQCAEVLQPGAAMGIFEHNPLNPLTRYVFERCVFDQDAEMIPRNVLMMQAASVGLRLRKKEYTLFFPKPLAALRPIERWLGWLPLGAQYYLELTPAG